MVIKSKFNVGQEVYIIFKNEKEPYVNIFHDVISEIVIDDEGIYYYGTKICEEFNENEIVSSKDINALIPKIKKLLLNNNDENEK